MSRFLTAAAVVCGLCACTVDRTGDPVPPQTLTRSIRIAAAAPVTRTELAPDGYNILWTPGDRIGIYVKSGDTFTTVNAPLTFEGAQAASEGTFAGDITLIRNRRRTTLRTLHSPLPRSRRRLRRETRRIWATRTSLSPGRCRVRRATSGRWHSATPLRSWRST